MMIEFLLLEPGEMALVKPLWQKLNAHHRSRSQHFARFYAKFTFEDRMAAILEHQNPRLRIEVARDADTQELVGYCISSVSESFEGEVDSIYIEPQYRKMKIGDRLMTGSLKWMEALGVKKKKITVAHGNEETFGFYEKYGFYPRLTILVAK